MPACLKQEMHCTEVSRCLRQNFEIGGSLLCSAARMPNGIYPPTCPIHGMHAGAVSQAREMRAHSCPRQTSDRVQMTSHPRPSTTDEHGSPRSSQGQCASYVKPKCGSRLRWRVLRVQQGLVLEHANGAWGNASLSTTPLCTRSGTTAQVSSVHYVTSPLPNLA